MSTILITGANRGIGLELVRQFHQSGWRVLACCRDPESAEKLAELAVNESVEVHRLDVSDELQISSLATRLSGESIDILLNNAGVYGPKSIKFGEITQQSWIEVLKVNTIAPVLMAQAFAGNVARSKHRVIATISSKVGSIADNSGGGAYPYRASKAGVNQMVKNLSIELADTGITCLALDPGWVQTEMGGPNALISVRQSATGLKQIMESAGLQQTGKFLNYDGSAIPW